LVRLLKSVAAVSGFYLYYPSRRQMLPALRALIDSFIRRRRGPGAAG